MRDTTSEFQRFVDARFRQLTPAERVRPGTEMFDAALTLIASGLPADLSDRERRRRITARLYGAAFAQRVLPLEA